MDWTMEKKTTLYTGYLVLPRALWAYALYGQGKDCNNLDDSKQRQIYAILTSTERLACLKTANSVVLYICGQCVCVYVGLCVGVCVCVSAP